jgi:hypothetical protein
MQFNHTISASPDNHLDFSKAINKDSDDEALESIRPLIDEGVGSSNRKDFNEICNRIKMKRRMRIGFSGVKAF